MQMPRDGCPKSISSSSQGPEEGISSPPLDCPYSGATCTTHSGLLLCGVCASRRSAVLSTGERTMELALHDLN